MHYKFSVLVFGFLLAGILVVSSCKKEDKTPQTIAFHLHNNVGNSAAALGIEYQTASGRKFILSDFRYYISNIVLIKADGSELPMADKVLLVNPNNQDYELGEVPVGDYKGFKFLLGLDSLTNSKDPATYPAGDPLAIQTPGIYWSWNSGYIFFKVEGTCDTTVLGNQSPNREFFHHIGLNQMKRSIDFTDSPFTIGADEENEIHFTFDLLKAYQNLDFQTEFETHTFNDVPLAQKIANNWQGAFSIE